jgi:hypothetical protein
MKGLKTFGCLRLLVLPTELRLKAAINTAPSLEREMNFSRSTSKGIFFPSLDFSSSVHRGKVNLVLECRDLLLHRYRGTE